MEPSDPEISHGPLKVKLPGVSLKNDSGLKAFAFFSVGIVTLVYCLAELGAALYIHSLALLSDGFHNLSDVVSLFIAYWAQNAAKRELSDEMSYGWGRAEILGGLTNGCFLLSLSLYVTLESIPKFIDPEKMDAGIIFICVAGAGLLVNTVGTLVFASVGLSHGHSHSHGHAHGHSHGDSHKHKDEKERAESQDHSHDHSAGHEHGHKHKDKKDKQRKEGHSHSHGHSHKHKDKKQKQKKGFFASMDLNVGAVFIHYLGDAVSSLCVLIAGILLHFLQHQARWIAYYIDPIISLFIVILIVVTTVPLVKRCSMILLQRVPSDIDMDALRHELHDLDSVVAIHDLHVWQLVDGMIIASVHLMLEEEEEGGRQEDVLYRVRRVFHKHGIHSSSIQPEFVKSKEAQMFCGQNCVEECEEDWCCKKSATRMRSVREYTTLQEI